VKDILDAVLELCLEFRVPLLHAAHAQAVLTTLGKEAMRPNTAEAHACSFTRLGGRAFGVGKLDGCLPSLQIGANSGDVIAPQDALLISNDLGDVIESSAHGMDSMLVLEDSSQLTSQLSAMAAAAKLEEQIARRTMSVAQRVQDDSPAMMHAASMPFLSFLQLPTLIAKARQQSTELKGTTSDQHVTPKSSADDPKGKPEASMPDDILDAVLVFCKAKGIRAPIGGMPHLRWDEHDSQTITAKASTNIARPSDVHAKEEHGRGQSRNLASIGRQPSPTSSANEEWRFPSQAESVGDILGKLQEKA